MNRKKLVCFMISFFICMPAFAAESEVGQYVSKLEKQYEAMKDFHADFQQETELASIKRVEKGEGSVYFKKGGKMLWEYTAPEAQKIILDGKTLWFYVPGDKQVMKNNFSTIPQHIMVDLFRGKINIQEKFKVSLVQQDAKDKKADIVLELIPAEYDPTLKKLMLWVNPEKFYITRSILEDEFGTKTVLRFLKIEIDKGIKDSLFEFIPPKGVEIFEPPQVQ